jgi:putative flippase GtrA
MLVQMLNASTAKQALRFALVGGLNTAIGFIIILGFLAAGFSDIVSNFTGYVCGLLISFFLNRSWTFGQSANPNRREIITFGFTFMIAYAANLIIVICGMALNLEGNPFVHLAGIAVYTTTFFLMSRNLVYNSVKSNMAIGERFNLSWPELIIIACACLAAPLFWYMPISHDVIWQFWIARQMLNGVPLYTHIMEINPPLWFWMAVPIQWLGSAIGVAPVKIYAILVLLVGSVSSLLAGKLVFPANQGRRLTLMLAIFVSGIVAPMNDFGQREQLAVLCSLPYCCLIFRRFNQETTNMFLAGAIGVLAAMGFALKHYFVLVPVALEIWYLFQHRQVRHFIRAETVALGVVALGYAACVLIFTPAFFSSIVPLVNGSYHGYEKPFIFQIVRSEVLVWFIAASSYILKRGAMIDRDRNFADMLAIAGTAFAASYFLQQKGWQYHAIPATVCATLLLIHCLSNTKDVISTAAKSPIATFGAMLFLAVGIARGPYSNIWADQMPKLLAQEAPGNSVMILTTDPKRGFPFVDDYNLVWPSRHFAHWMISAIAQAETGANGQTMNPALLRIAEDTRNQAIDDIRCNPPSLILSQIKNSGEVISPKRFRMTDFFRRNSDFKEYLAVNYIQQKNSGVFEVYRRRTPLEAKGPNCYNISVAR